MSKMSINIFKKHPGNKVTFSNRAIFSGELKIMRSRPKMIFCVHGSRECRMLDMWFVVRYIGEHPSTPPLSFLQVGCPSCRPTSSVKLLKADKLW